MKVKKHNYFNFIPEVITKTMEGNPIYCNDLDIKGKTWSVYSSANPNREKGHKDFMMLTIDQSDQAYVSGMDKNTIYPYRIVNAVHCLDCDEVIYSPNVHSLVYCQCKSIFIDGGASYCRIGHNPGFTNWRAVKLDALTDAIIPEELK